MSTNLILLRRRMQENVAEEEEEIQNQASSQGTMYQRRFPYSCEEFFKIFRIYREQFEILLYWVAPHIMRDPTKGDIIPPDERICVTPQFLATGAFKTIG